MTAAVQMVGSSPRFLRAIGLIERMARFDAPVLIVGETGTGKELAARSIHYQSARKPAPFVAVNCGALPDALVENELYGCERGAFTDARQSRTGLIAAAEGGTLFLDELDSLPLRAQVSMLRFLQDFSYRPVGSSRECFGNVRIIAAASPRLDALLKSGDMRDDLVLRVAALELDMPPLRERRGDAALLARYFIGRHCRHYGLAPRALHDDCLAWLDSYAWPGNLRELDNLVRRALLLSDDERLRLAPAAAGHAADGDLPLDTAAPGGFSESRERALHSFERSYLQQILAATDGNVTHAARLAGKERRYIGKLIKKHGLQKSVGRGVSVP